MTAMTSFEASPLLVRAAAFAVAFAFVAASLAIVHAGGRKKLRIAALALALLAGFAVVARPRLLPGGATAGLLITPGGGEAVRHRGPQFLAPGAERVPVAGDATRGAGGGVEGVRANDASTDVQPLGRWAELAARARWQLRGAGLTAEEWRAVPSGVEFEPDAEFRVRGLVDIRWPRRVTLGDVVTVVGRFASDSAPGGPPVVLRLSGPGGVEAESAPLGGEAGGFRLQLKPRAVGRLLLELEERSTADAVPVRRHTLDVVVAPPSYPRVRIVAERPSPDANALRRWLTGRGADVDWQVAMGGGTVATSRGRRASNDPALGDEVVVTFSAAPPSRGRSGEAAAAAVQLITARGGELAPLTLEEPRGDVSAARTGDTRSESWIALVSSANGSSFAWLSAARTPSVAPIRIERGVSPDGRDRPDRRAESLVVGSYRYLLRGDESSYAELWSVLLEAVRPPRATPTCQHADGPVRVDEPIALVCRTEAPPRLILIGDEVSPSEEIALSPHSLDTGRYDAVVWPRREGWSRLMLSAGTQVGEVEFFAQPRHAWTGWDEERRVRATAAHLQEATSDAGLVRRSTDRGRAPGRRAVSPAICWAILVGALAVLWGVERSNG
jgi:hypothetical protein